ncbi:chitin deacetylase [Thoreauomyces humboldtii]|nr:chitin deacetylase [Thoreauomyces humboldtii]
MITAIAFTLALSAAQVQAIVYPAQVPAALVLGTAVPSPNAAQYANMPTIFPDPNEAAGPISDATMLAHPLVQTALAHVNAVVPAALLNLSLSVPVDGFSTVTYPAAQMTSACYWGFGATSNCNVPAAADLTKYAPYLLADLTNCPGTNVLGLSYDDAPSGPAQETTSTVDLAAKLLTMQQKATFFVVGSSSAYNPSIVQDLYKAGHELAVHTWTHTALTTLTNEQIVAEIKYTEAIIYYLTGVRPRYARSPYGDTDNRVRAVIGALGYQLVSWDNTKDTGDSDFPTGTSLATMEAQVLNTWASWYKGIASQKGFIELEHSLNTNSNVIAIAALDQIVAAKANNSFPLTMMPVGQCMSQTSYVPLDFTLGANATTSSSAAVSSATSAAVSRVSSAAAAATGKASTGSTGSSSTTASTSDAANHFVAKMVSGSLVGAALCLSLL